MNNNIQMKIYSTIKRIEQPSTKLKKYQNTITQTLQSIYSNENIYKDHISRISKIAFIIQN